MNNLNKILMATLISAFALTSVAYADTSNTHQHKSTKHVQKKTKKVVSAKAKPTIVASSDSTDMSKMDHSKMDMPSKSEATTLPMVDGEVRKVDKDTGKITIKHSDIPNLKMMGMTMVFKAKDPAMLDQVKQGDKVKFTADRVDGTLTVTKIEVAN